MRGRTNVTQRTGPSVIGKLVTQKQVTGDKIEVGDFVEFTGNTSNWESLSGPFNFPRASRFKIDSDYSGVFYYNAVNSQCKFIIFDKDGVVNITNLSNIGFDYGASIHVSVNQGKIDILSSLSATFKRYRFTINQDYSISYVETVDIPDFRSSESYSHGGLLCVKDKYIYAYDFTGSTDSNKLYIIQLDMNGTRVYRFMVENIGYTNKSIFTTDNYIFILYNNSNGTSSATIKQVIFEFASKKIVVQVGSLPYLYNCQAGRLVELDGYFFMVGWVYSISTNSSSSRTNYAYANVFYLDDNLNIKIIDSCKVGDSIGQYYMGVFDTLVEKEGDNYIIVAVYSGRNWNNNVYYGYNYYYSLLNFDSFNSDIKELDDGHFYDTVHSISGVELAFLRKYDSIYNIYYTHNYNTDASVNNYLCKTKFIISDNKIKQMESLDLVKKYSSHIDGVAKTEGSAGQQISVYIP